MFLYEDKQTKKEPMSDHQFYSTMFAVAMGLLALWIYKYEDYLLRLFFQNFEILALIFFAILCVFALLARKKFEKWSEAFSKRANLLKSVGSPKAGVFIGCTTDGAKIFLPEKIRTGHVQIIGATGRGKTESVILPWFMRDLYKDHSAVLIDGKGDRELFERIEKYIEDLEKKPKLIVFDLGNANRSAVTNPLKMGTSQQITDRIFAAFEFEDPFYKAVQYEITSLVVELLFEFQEEITLKRLYFLLAEDDLLTELVGKSKNQQLVKRLTSWLAEPRKDRSQKIAGIVSQLGPFATGEVSKLVNGKTENQECFSLAEILSRKTGNDDKVALVILLPTLLYQEIAFKLGKLFLQEAAWAVAAREDNTFTPLFLDEFSSFVYKGFTAILNKARSSGIALHLSHQSLGDLEQVSDGFAKAINANTNVKCLLGLNDPLTADFFAKHLGTVEEEKITERAKNGGLFRKREKTGDVSVRAVEAYKIHPNRLKNYTCGTGVIQFALQNGTITEEINFEALPRGSA